MHLLGGFTECQILFRKIDAQKLQCGHHITVTFALNPQAMQLLAPQGSKMPSLSSNFGSPLAQSRLAVEVDALGSERLIVLEPGTTRDPMIECRYQPVVSGRVELLGQAAMGFFLHSHDRAPRALCPAAITLSSRIVYGDIVVACLAKGRVQPTQLLADRRPRSIFDHGREEKNCSTEPRELHSHGVNGFRIGRNGRPAITLDKVDAALRDFLK